MEKTNYCNGEYSVLFQKSSCPENYLPDLMSFFENCKSNSNEDFIELNVTINDMEIINEEMIISYYYYIQDGNIDNMIEDVKKTLNTLDYGYESDEEEEFNFIAEKMRAIDSYENSTFKETKKGIYMHMSGGVGDFPIFIDDTGMKIIFEYKNNTFDTQNYL